MNRERNIKKANRGKLVFVPYPKLKSKYEKGKFFGAKTGKIKLDTNFIEKKGRCIDLSYC